MSSRCSSTTPSTNFEPARLVAPRGVSRAWRCRQLDVGHSISGLELCEVRLAFWQYLYKVQGEGPQQGAQLLTKDRGRGQTAVGPGRGRTRPTCRSDGGRVSAFQYVTKSVLVLGVHQEHW